MNKLNNFNKLLAEFDVNDRIVEISCLGKCGIHLNNTRRGRLTLIFMNFLRAFYKACFARKSLSIVHKTLSSLVWRSNGSSLSIPLKENLQHTNSCFEEKNRKICKLKSTINFFSMLLITILILIPYNKELSNLMIWSSILQIKK